VSSVLKSNDV